MAGIRDRKMAAFVPSTNPTSCFAASSFCTCRSPSRRATSTRSHTSASAAAAAPSRSLVEEGEATHLVDSAEGCSAAPDGGRRSCRPSAPSSISPTPSPATDPATDARSPSASQPQHASAASSPDARPRRSPRPMANRSEAEPTTTTHVNALCVPAPSPLGRCRSAGASSIGQTSVVV